MSELLALYALVALAFANAIAILAVLNVIDVRDAGDLLFSAAFWPTIAVALTIWGCRWARDRITSVRLF